MGALARSQKLLAIFDKRVLGGILSRSSLYGVPPKAHNAQSAQQVNKSSLSYGNQRNLHNSPPLIAQN